MADDSDADDDDSDQIAVTGGDNSAVADSLVHKLQEHMVN